MQIKRCYVCKQEKDVSEFYLSSTAQDSYQGRCKVCSLKTANEHYRNNKQTFAERANSLLRRIIDWVDTIKTKYGCCVCGISNPKCLDFHHVNPSEKLDGVGNLVRKKSRIKVAEEINKCVVICANCHRLTHFGDVVIDETKRCQIPIPEKSKKGKKPKNTR